MRVELKGGKKIGDLELRKAEKQLSLRFPTEFADFVRDENGATPDPNIFPVAEGQESGVNRFIPLQQIEKERKNLGSVTRTWIPIAWAEGGNYVCLDTACCGGVFFWDHEDPDTTHRLSDSLSTFLLMLSPFSAEDIELDPDRVKKAWIDPDFLKSLDQK